MGHDAYIILRRNGDAHALVTDDSLSAVVHFVIWLGSVGRATDSKDFGMRNLESVK